MQIGSSNITQYIQDRKHKIQKRDIRILKSFNNQEQKQPYVWWKCAPNHWKKLLMTKGGNLENRRWKILGCPSEKCLVVQVRNTWTNRSHFWHIWTRQEINWALSIRRWPHATFTCMLQSCKYLLSHLWLYKLYLLFNHAHNEFQSPHIMFI